MPHSHQHGNCSHEATDADVDPLEMGIEYSLFEKIDFNNLVSIFFNQKMDLEEAFF